MPIWNNVRGLGWRKADPNESIPVRQPAALPRPIASSPASSPAGTSAPVKSAVPAAGGSLPPEARPYAKGAGSWVPPGTSPGPTVATEVISGAPGEIPVKAHVRKPAAVQEEPEPTADSIVEEVGKRNRRNTRDSLSIGWMVYRFILHQPERPADAQFGRNGALEHLRERFLAAKYDEGSCRVDRDLRCYHLVYQFGGDARGVNISVIRTMLPLLEKEQGKERPKLKEAYVDAARALWQRAVAEKLTAAAVRIEVLKILPAKRPRDVRQQKSRQAVTVLRLIPMLSPEERRLALRAIREADAAAKLQPAAAIAG